MIREILLKITEACPCTCKFCDASAKYLDTCQNELTDEEWFSVCRDIIDNQIEVVIISGGEALIRKKLVFDMIDLLKSSGIFVVLNTSGVMFKNTLAVDEIVRHYPSLLVFSIDGATEAAHDLNRGVDGLFERVYNTICRIKSQGEYSVAIRTVITKKNYTELADIVKIFNEIGVDCIKFTHIENDYEGNYLLGLNEIHDLREKIVPKMLDVVKECKVENNFMLGKNLDKIKKLFSRDGMKPEKYESSCFAPKMVGNEICPILQRFITIQSNGDYLPCCEAEHHGWPNLGNVRNKNLVDVLQSESYMFYVNNRQEYCKRCTEWDNFQLDFCSSCRKVEQR